jgi:hypothetical protein
MRVILLSLFLVGCAAQDAYYDPSPKTQIPNLPSVKGAGSITKIPSKKMTDQEKDDLIAQLRESEIANARGYVARGRAFNNIQKIYKGEKANDTPQP